ncbi:4d536984-030f-4648-8762-2f12ad30572a [Thermothielavioides terrestris]|nr:4d536984-030f-4648-8762-2f12ad30572a [Thermothielavioides terrestris]
MTNMARHGSVGAFSGFSVSQPALGAALQWLPAIGTPELDEMINAFLPGPASIQDKRAHISMDFFEYSRRTGENFKFYPVPSGSFTPVTASPATSALYDSGYASSLNYSSVLSPAPVALAPSDGRTQSRSSASRKSSSSSSRRETVDFANHPGMRILTKDGRDVTNSASRGCKTKEQRDHAHLMRIIKACDACRKKKVRCDPSHRKRNASQSSPSSQPEQKPVKRSRKAEESPPVTVADASADLFAGVLNAPEVALTFPAVDAGFPQDLDEFWNDFITFDPEPAPVAAAPNFDDFVFDPFTDSQNFSPSSGSSSTSPSQTFTPFTPAPSGGSPATASDAAADLAGGFSLQDPTVPYLNPGVAHGTNYIDFNLYSPGPEIIDDDPVLQLRDLTSRQPSPQSHELAQAYAIHNSPRALAAEPVIHAPISWATSAGDRPVDERPAIAASSIDGAWYYDPEPSFRERDRTSGRSSTLRQLNTNHNRLAGSEAGVPCPSSDGRITHGDASEIGPLLPVSSTAMHSEYHNGGAPSTVFARAAQSSVSPCTSPGPRRLEPATVAGPASSTVEAAVSTDAVSPRTISQLATAAAWQPRLLRATGSTSSAASSQPCHGVVDGSLGSAARHDQGCVSSSLASQLLPGRELGSSALVDALRGVQLDVGAAHAMLRTTVFSTLPTRCNVAGEGVINNTFFFQLAVFGLVSLLCARALQALLADQVNLVNILAISSISLARLAPRCAGPPSVALPVSKTLPSPPPSPSGIVGQVRSTIQSVTGSLGALRCTVSRRVRRIVPRLPSVQTWRLQ